MEPNKLQNPFFESLGVELLITVCIKHLEEGLETEIIIFRQISSYSFDLIRQFDVLEE